MLRNQGKYVRLPERDALSKRVRAILKKGRGEVLDPTFDLVQELRCVADKLNPLDHIQKKRKIIVEAAINDGTRIRHRYPGLTTIR